MHIKFTLDLRVVFWDDWYAYVVIIKSVSIIDHSLNWKFAFAIVWNSHIDLLANRTVFLYVSNFWRSTLFLTVKHSCNSEIVSESNRLNCLLRPSSQDVCEWYNITQINQMSAYISYLQKCLKARRHITIVIKLTMLKLLCATVSSIYRYIVARRW